MSRCLSIALLLVLACGARAAEPPAPDVEFFEKEIRPLLVEKCQKCHGDTKTGGGLNLTSRATVLKGGETGPALVPGKPAESLLLKAVSRTGELKMPPKEELSAKEIEKLKQWVARGALWPESSGTGATTEKQRKWWAFQPAKEPKVPVSRKPKASANPPRAKHSS